MPLDGRNVDMATFRRQPDPFWEGPHISKSEIKAFTQHRSDIRTGLATKLWIETTLCSLPQDHQRRNSLALLLDEYSSPHSRSSSGDEGYVSASPGPSTPRTKCTRFTDLPPAVRQKVYTVVLSSSDSTDSLNLAVECQRLQTLADVHPILRPEIDRACQDFSTPESTILQPTDTITTSFRINGVWSLFDAWFQSLRTESLTTITTIQILVWSWHWHDGDEQDWRKHPDTITLHISPSTSTRHISLTRESTATTTTTLSPTNLCTCSPEALIQSNGIAENFNATAITDLPAFVRALRRGDEMPVVQTIRALANLVQMHDRELKRDSAVVKLPQVCRYCRGRRVYLSSFAS